MEVDNIKKKSIVDIFNDMDYQEKAEESSAETGDDLVRIFGKVPSTEIQSSNLLSKVLKAIKAREFKSVDDAIEVASKAQAKWKSASAVERSNLLLKFWKSLSENRELLFQLENFGEKEFSLFGDYFEFYSDLALLIDEHAYWKPIGTVLVLLSDDCPFYILGAVISASLAAGCSLIVQTPHQRSWFPFFLSEIFSQIGLLKGLFNCISKSVEEEEEELSPKVDKIVFCGSYLLAQNYYKRNLSKSFNFLCPNNTAAIILESCDLSAAVDKIVFESWGSNSATLWGVSTVIIQESIYQQFLDKLRIRVQQLIKDGKSFAKFKEQIMLDKISKVTTEAIKAGADVLESFCCENEWNPPVILHYQDQDIDPGLPILKVLTCRTATEGVTLLNNSRYCLGVSIWTEISSQALEVASLLLCKNVWINCHGIIKNVVPLCPSGTSESGVFGGIEGIFEYMTFGVESSLKFQKEAEDKGFNVKQQTVVQTAVLAKAAFSKWHSEKSRRTYLKDLADSLENNEELAGLQEIINYYAHVGNFINFSDSNCSQDFLTVQKKIPLGVIAIILNNFTSDIKYVASLIAPAIAFGNAVVLVLSEDNVKIKSMVKHFNSFLPKNLLNVIVGVNSSYFLASDPIIQALWLCDESALSAEFLKQIKFHSRKTFKHIWIVPKLVPQSQHLFAFKCLRNKVIWLTKVDHFP